MNRRNSLFHSFLALLAVAVPTKAHWPRLQRELQTRGGEIDALLARTNAVAEVIGFNATPALIVDSQVVAGAVDLPTLRRLVATAHSKHQVR